MRNYTKQSFICKGCVAQYRECVWHFLIKNELVSFLLCFMYPVNIVLFELYTCLAVKKTLAQGTFSSPAHLENSLYLTDSGRLGVQPSTTALRYFSAVVDATVNVDCRRPSRLARPVRHLRAQISVGIAVEHYRIGHYAPRCINLSSSAMITRLG